MSGRWAAMAFHVDFMREARMIQRLLIVIVPLEVPAAPLKAAARCDSHVF
jgi:hypothetical protein